MRVISIILIITVFVSCHSAPNKGIGETKLLEGFWIPDSINWLVPESGLPEIDTVIRYANFQTLYFDKENRFYIFQSTQNLPKNYDSLVFESEPGISLYKGEWDFIDSTNLMVDYKFKKGSFKKRAFKDTISVVYEGNIIRLFFNETTYKRTYLYDKQSMQRMEAYKTEWLPD